MFEPVYSLDYNLNKLDRETLAAGHLYYLYGWDTRMGSYVRLRNAVTGKERSHGTYKDGQIACRTLTVLAEKYGCKCHWVKWNNYNPDKGPDLGEKVVPSPLPSHGIEVRIVDAFAPGYYNVLIYRNGERIEGQGPGTQNGLDAAHKEAEKIAAVLGSTVVQPEQSADPVRDLKTTGRITRTFSDIERTASPATGSVAYSDDGGKTWRWASNDTFIMLDVCKDYGIPCDVAAQQAARDAQVSEFLKKYRETQPATPSAEEVAEARAAFGPGKEVVDVITGRKFTT